MQKDILSIFNKNSKKIEFEEFFSMPTNKQAFEMANMDIILRKRLLKHLSNEKITKIINYLDPDEITDILQELNPIKRKSIMLNLNKHIQEKITFLLKFNPNIAAGIMSLEYIEIDYTKKISDAIELLEKHEKKTGKIPSILVVKEGFLLGELPIDNLIFNKKSDEIIDFVKSIPHVKFDMEKKEVLKTFKNNPHNKVVVLDEDESIIGVIYSDDIIREISNTRRTDLADFAGVNKEENIFDPFMSKVKNRYKWLIINLMTAFMAAGIVSLFEDTISKLTLLAVYMPIVAGMGGNAGTQTLAVMVRGIALNEITFQNSKSAIVNEVIAGGINGVINGIIVAVIALLWNQSPLLGLIIGFSMVINLIIAGFFGAIIPLILKSFGKDPATSATIFITTATDVFGFFVFLGLATLII